MLNNVKFVRASKMAKNHHRKNDFSYSRPDYREARWERAVKAYTINQESKYLLVQGVPAVGVRDELIQMFALYGDVEEYRLLDEYPGEKFTDVYWIKFDKIQAARFAKRKLDNRSFYGSCLHVCYAPEYESVGETRRKLHERRIAVARKIKDLQDSNHFATEKDTKANTSLPIKSTSSTSRQNTCTHSDPSPTPPNYLPLNPVPVTGFNPDPNNQIRYYPMLPPPPMHQNTFQGSWHPSNMFNTPPPPPPPSPMQSHSSQRYPRVPSSHATLPKHLQEDVEMDNISVRPIASKSSNIQVRNLPDKKPSKIVWNKPMMKPFVPEPKASSHVSPINISVPLDRSKETFAVQQGPWDPYYRKRKTEQSLTGSDDMDKLVDRVRKKLSKLSDS